MRMLIAAVSLAIICGPVLAEEATSPQQPSDSAPLLLSNSVPGGISTKTAVAVGAAGVALAIAVSNSSSGGSGGNSGTTGTTGTTGTSG